MILARALADAAGDALAARVKVEDSVVDRSTVGGHPGDGIDERRPEKGAITR